MDKTCPHCGRACNSSQTVRLEIKNGETKSFEETIHHCGGRNCLLAIMAGLQVKVGQTIPITPTQNEAAHSNT